MTSPADSSNGTGLTNTEPQFCPPGWCSMLAADPAERLADRRMLGFQRLPGDTAGACDRGDTAAQCGQCVALAGCRQIGSNDLRRGRHRLETMPVTPGPVVRKVGRVGSQRGWGVCRIPVGL